MSNTFVGQLDGANFMLSPNEDMKEGLFKQYERVIVKSIITSFGLDFLISDRNGGDVDTIHNIRNNPNDYKSERNKQNYENRGAYNSNEYHGNSQYIETNRYYSNQKKNSNLYDSYTNKKIAPNEKMDLDHVVSAKEIHDDPGRVLSGLSGVELANSPENLKPTNPHTNRQKKADTMEDYLEKHGDEYTDKEKARMRETDKKARSSIEAKINKAYYTSPAFWQDSAIAAGKVGLKMGLRQALGFVFVEIWFAIKEEFEKVNSVLSMDASEFFNSLGNAVKRGIENCKKKYKQLLESFKDGALAGILSSLTTTLCNIFFTTGKNIVRIIRQAWTSIVEALKILFINPDQLPFGDRMLAFTKVIATGASVVIGVLINEAVASTALGQIPVVGEVVSVFCGAFVTGIMSCTLLYILDTNPLVKKLVTMLNSFKSTYDIYMERLREEVALLEEYAAKLMEIDLDSFKKEVKAFSSISEEISSAPNELALNNILENAYKKMGFQKPWEKAGFNSFDDFMNDKNATIIFC